MPIQTIQDISPTITGHIGKSLFKENCAQCHAKNMRSHTTGPALQGLMTNWEHDTIGLRHYLNNSKAYIEREVVSERFDRMYKEFGNGANMHANDFSVDEVHSLILYIEAMSK